MRAAPLLAILVFARATQAGICWSSMSRGRCSSVWQQRVSRDACCAGRGVAWSRADLDSGALFFWKALNGGVACEPCTQSCAGVTCGAGRTCAVRGGRARCVCGGRCVRAGPVCGSDGRTYRSLCRLKRRACRRSAAHLVMDYPGPCRTSCADVSCAEGKTCVLDAELSAHCARCPACDPAGEAAVCGADGRTYAGTCALRRAACEQGRAVPLAYRAPCIQNATCAQISCGRGQACAADAGGARCVTCACARGRRRELCAADGRTYSWCALQQRVCRTGVLLPVRHPGPCRRNETVDFDSDVRVFSSESNNSV